MSWPLSQDFNEAIQNPASAFSDPDLKAAEPVVGARGLPLPRSGNFADVYQMHGADGRDWAVKCFTRPVTGLAQRYAAISDALHDADLPFTIGFSYLAEGIRVAGVWRPVVKMEWVEGLLLNQVARENAGKPGTLAALGQMWVKLCRRLREARVAHADLQHGNVILVPGSRPGAYGLKLIDYDGMYVPALANSPSGESGHPAFQHPRRSGTAGYSPDVDRFPHLLIASALKGLEVGGTAIWERYDTGDNLLFVESDLKSPASSKVMRELWQTEHPGVQALVGRLALATQQPIPQTPWLDQLAPDGEAVPLDDKTRWAATEVLGLGRPVPVPLPPDPTEAPAALRTAPTGSRLTPALPPQPAPKPAAPKRPVAPVEEELDVELVEVKPKEKGTKERLRYQPKSGGSSARWLILGGVVLLAGGIVGVVALTGDKPKPQVAEKPPEDKGDPKDKEPKDKEPKEKEPKGKTDPIVPIKPKEKDKEPVKPPVVPPDLKDVAFKERQRFPVTDTTSTRPIEFDPEGGHLVYYAQENRLLGRDLRTNEFRILPGLAKSNMAGLPGAHMLPGGRLATWVPGGQSVVLYDLKTGVQSGTLEVPSLPASDAPNIGSHMRVSPDGRYVALGRRSYYRSPTADADRVALPVPLRVLDTRTNKEPVAFDWQSHFIHFTSDSSRVLVIDAYAQARWFTLPKGEPDGEWKYGNQTSGASQLHVEAVSGGGEVLLCYGRAGERKNVYFALNGRTGEVISILGEGFMALVHASGISADGRVAVVLAPNVGTREVSLVAFDVTRGAELARVKLPEWSQQLLKVAISRDGRTVAVAGQWREEKFSPNDVLVYDLLKAPSEVVVVPKKPDPAREPVALKVRWEAPVVLPPMQGVHLDPANNLLVLGSDLGTAILDLRTGAAKKEFATLTSAKAYRVYPLEKGRFATLTNKRDDLEIWDPKTGKVSERLTVPNLPAGPADVAGVRVALSPNQKYLAVGRAGLVVPNQAEAPFRIVDAVTRKAIVTTDWRGGDVFFTADSSRVLVAEWAGRARWFKLPSGAEDEGWDFAPVPPAHPALVLGMSGDGKSVVFKGQVAQTDGGRRTTQFVFGLLDAKTGRPVFMFPKGYTEGFASLSADGRRVALLRSSLEKQAIEWTIDVLDVATGGVFARARLESSGSIPQIELTPDGKTLIVQNTGLRKAYLFDIPDDTVAPK